jgi:lipid-A-disaccharide synthase
MVYNQTYDLLSNAVAAVVVSGTATLETALFKVPQVVLYKLSTPTYLLAVRSCIYGFFSLVNIIMNRQCKRNCRNFTWRGT